MTRLEIAVKFLTAQMNNPRFSGGVWKEMMDDSLFCADRVIEHEKANPADELKARILARDAEREKAEQEDKVAALVQAPRGPAFD